MEARLDPMVDAFDRRGRVLKALNDAFKTKMQHWSGENVAVQVTDNLEKPSRTVRVDHRSFVIVYEDPETLDEFIADTLRKVERHSVSSPLQFSLDTPISER